MPKSASLRSKSSKSSKASKASKLKAPSKQLSILEQLTTIEEWSAEEVVQELIDELMENVMNKCYKVYMDKQTISFTLHCFQQAFTKLLHLYCYRHGDYDRNDQFWGPDLPPEKSAPDSWAANQVPIYENVIDESAPLNSMSYLGIDMDNISELGVPPSDRTSSSVLDDMERILEEILDRVNMMAQDPVESVSSQSKVSIFTQIAESNVSFKNYLIKAPSGIYKSHSVKLPKIELTPFEEKPECFDHLSHLPPIRIESSYRCKKQPPLQPQTPTSDYKKRKK